MLPAELFPTFNVEVSQIARVPASAISSMLAIVTQPRPGQTFTVRDLPTEFAAEVVYLRESQFAPAYRVTYLELAQAWAAALSARRVDDKPQALAHGAASLVVDVACGHVLLERGV